MKLNFWPFHFSIISDDLGKKGDNIIVGNTKAPFIWYLRGYENDERTIKHELWHLKQSYKLLIIFHLLLLNNFKYAAWCERKATEAEGF